MQAGRETVLECAAESRAIVTAENHNVIGGLGSAVAELLSENLPTPLARVGRQDQFGEVGPMEYLQEAFGLTARHIADKAIALLD